MQVTLLLYLNWYLKVSLINKCTSNSHFLIIVTIETIKKVLQSCLYMHDNEFYSSSFKVSNSSFKFQVPTIKILLKLFREIIKHLTISIKRILSIYLVSHFETALFFKAHSFWNLIFVFRYICFKHLIWKKKKEWKKGKRTNHNLNQMGT